MKEVPIWEKSNLTLEEAAAYSGIGINKLREMSDSKDCTLSLIHICRVLGNELALNSILKNGFL